MMIKDFKKKNCQLIILRPNPNILMSIQSLSDEQILMARNEIDLIAILGKKSTTQDDTIVLISETNKRTSTWL